MSHSNKINFKGLLTLVKNGDYDKVKLLLEKQGLIANNPNNRLALYRAIEAKNYEIVKLLVDYGILAIEAKDNIYYASLDYAGEDREMLEILLQAGATTVGKNFKRETPIIRAMNKEHFSAVDTMLSVYDINSIDPSDKNEIIHFTIAAIRGNRNLVESFLQKGMVVDSILTPYVDEWTRYISTPLHCAVKHVSVEGVEILLKYGANITIQNKNGCSPLHLAYYIWKDAVKSYHPVYYESQISKIIDLILLAHRKIALQIANPTDENGISHLHIASVRTFSEKQSIEVMKLLLEANFDVNAQDKLGKTALWFAALDNNTEGDKILLSYGADINIKNNENVSLLFEVSQMIKKRYAMYNVFKILIMHVRYLILISHPVSLETEYIYVNSKSVESTAMKDSIKEVEKLKKHKINNYNSFYDILFKTEQQMTAYGKNESFKNDLDVITRSNVYPNYGYILNWKFRQGLMRNRILDQARQCLQLLIGKKISFPDTCVDSIFNYLTIKDLENLSHIAE